MRVAFAKLHGLGNDFVVVDFRAQHAALRGVDSGWFDDVGVIRRVCDRHRGVGADGVLGIFPPTDVACDAGAMARMRVRNADGSEAEMCGNGLRCVARQIGRLGGPTQLRVETGAGILSCDVAPDGQRVQIEMGPARPIDPGGAAADGWTPARRAAQVIEIGDVGVPLFLVSMGNPHAVHFVDAPMADDGLLYDMARTIGPRAERHPMFPSRTNVEFVRRVDVDHWAVVVWERGCGITQACGTGACAVAVAACLRGDALPGRPLRIDLPGGALSICVQPDYGQVLMRGPVEHVFDGELTL